MAAAIASKSFVPVQPALTADERLALTGYLAGYRRLTREAYTLDLRQFIGWCGSRSLRLFSVRRADIETFARELEAKGRAGATVTRRLSTIARFYKYAVEEELLDHSPAAHVRLQRLDYESHATAMDRNEVGALLVAAGPGPAPEHARISLLALNGLRVSEATGRFQLSGWRSRHKLARFAKWARIMVLSDVVRTRWDHGGRPLVTASWAAPGCFGRVLNVNGALRWSGITGKAGPVMAERGVEGAATFGDRAFGARDGHRS